jgi:hypothetical protein
MLCLLLLLLLSSNMHSVTYIPGSNLGSNVPAAVHVAAALSHHNSITAVLQIVWLCPCRHPRHRAHHSFTICGLPGNSLGSSSFSNTWLKGPWPRSWHSPAAAEHKKAAEPCTARYAKPRSVPAKHAPSICNLERTVVQAVAQRCSRTRATPYNIWLLLLLLLLNNCLPPLCSARHVVRCGTMSCGIRQLPAAGPPSFLSAQGIARQGNTAAAAVTAAAAAVTRVCPTTHAR